MCFPSLHGTILSPEISGQEFIARLRHLAIGARWSVLSQSSAHATETPKKDGHRAAFLDLEGRVFGL